MRTALITTSIHVPKVLALYRKLGPDVKFFVAADEKTPLDAYSFCADIPDCEIYSPDRQKELGYECSALIGWNCVQRRNIALLEAVKWGADVIVTIDDDNASATPSYFYEFQKRIGGFSQTGGLVSLVLKDWPFDGIKASSPTGWFDPGCLLVPQTKHRGFPVGIKADPVFESVTDAKIGVAAGLCLGDPDIDAVTRIALKPTIHSVSELARSGIVVDPKDTKTVFNSQNTAFIRELAPAMFMMPGIGRYDDIYASLICQKLMCEKDLYVHFGQPFVWQQRNEHNLCSDLRAEIDGMENVRKFGEFLDAIVSGGNKTNITWLRDFYYLLSHYGFVPETSIQAAIAFLDDVEKAL